MRRKAGKVVSFHVKRTAPKVKHTVERDDLIQIAQIKAWQAVEHYDGSRPLEVFLHEVLWRSMRDVVRGERRRVQVIEAAGSRDDLPEVHDHKRPDDDIILQATVAEYKAVLSPLAYTVLHEYAFPSEKTARKARERMIRKTHLKKRGVDVHGHDQVKLTPRAIAESLGQPLSRIYKALAEIKRHVKGR